MAKPSDTSNAATRRHYRRKPTAVRLPLELSSTDDVELALRQLGDTLRRIDKITGERDARAAKIQSRFEIEYGPLARNARETSQKILQYAEDHRNELTKAQAQKFATFIQGRVRWQQSTRLNVADDVAHIIAVLKEHGLYDQFVRVTEELDRQALLQERNRASWQDIEGLAVHERELFYIEPKDTDLFTRFDPDLSDHPWNLDRRKKKIR